MGWFSDLMSNVFDPLHEHLTTKLCQHDNSHKHRKEQEWDDEKNLPFTPETVSPSSSVPVWWKCEKGHSWQTQVRSRSKTLTRCPKCLATELSKKRKQQVKEFAKKMSCK